MINYETGFHILFDEKVMNEGLNQAIKWWFYNIGDYDWLEQIGVEVFMDYLLNENIQMEIEVDKEPDFDLGEQWKPNRHILRPLEDAESFYTYGIMTALYDLHKSPILMIVKYNYNEETAVYNNEVWITFDGETFSGSIEEV
jgi:hypothetical protein